MALIRFYFTRSGLKADRKSRIFFLSLGNVAYKADGELKGCPEIDGHEFKI